MLGRDLSAGRWETEVAHLAGQGMTNAEIAAGLFITPPEAVEYHLGNIYAKFGVKGRHQLRRLLSDSRRRAPPDPAAQDTVTAAGRCAALAPARPPGAASRCSCPASPAWLTCDSGHMCRRLRSARRPGYR